MEMKLNTAYNLTSQFIFGVTELKIANESIYKKESPFENELKTLNQSVFLLDAYQKGSLFITSAIDYAEAILKLIFIGDMQTIAPYTCFRSLIETCAISSWLLDNKINAVSRVRRDISFGIYDLTQKKRFFNSINNTSQVKIIENKINQLKKDVNTLTACQDKINKFPSFTDIVEMELKLSIVYRKLSSLCHSNPQTLRVLAFEKTEIHDGIWMCRNLTEQSVFLICNFSIQSIFKATHNLGTISGWNMSSLITEYQDCREFFDSLSSE